VTLDGVSTVAGLAPGDHACLAFDDDRGYLATATDYVRDAVRSGHKVLYFVDPCRRAMVEPLVTDAVTLLPAPEAYLSDGAFDTDRTTKLLHGEIAQARAEGWPALRIIGDMSWAFGAVCPEVLADYEAHVNRVYAEGYAMAICLYDRRLFDLDTLTAVGMAHPHTLRPDESPLLRIRVTDGARVLRLTGEIDLSNQAAVEAVVGDLVARGALTIDVSGLRFMAGATASMLIRTAMAAPDSLRLVGADRALRNLLDLCAGGRSLPWHLETAR
jgi:anti-anti-sigma factor